MLHNKVTHAEGLKCDRRRFLQTGLAVGLITAGAPTSLLSVPSPGSAPTLLGAGTGDVEDIRSSQSTVLEAVGGQVEKVRIGALLFQDTKDVLANLPEEFLARSFIRSNKGGVKATCREAGFVYAFTAAESEQAQKLAARGFKQLDFPAFQIFQGQSGTMALAFQKFMEAGEKLELGNWAILIFGPEERGGVPYSKMRPLEPPAFLPDGSEFKTWEVPFTFSRTYYVNQSHPHASDNNTGTQELPFKSINRAAQALEPGERVIVSAGVYRECVRPARGGTDPEHIISYEATPGAHVVLKGSEILKMKWVKSAPWIQDTRSEQVKSSVKAVWMAHLPPELFVGYNPFGTANYRQVDQMPYWNLPEVFGDWRAKLYLQVCGLLFQNGRRLQQVTHYTDLYTMEGAFWVETNGLVIHISPYDGIDPNQAEWEATAREQIFAPEEYNLGFIRVKGFTLEHAGNTFPFPQRGAISTMMGHHWLIEDNTVQGVNSVGIDIGDQGEPPSARPEILGYHVLRGNTLNDIGITGVTGPGPFNTLIENNVFRRNAWQDCEPLAEMGAIKTHHNLNVLVRRNLVFDTLHGASIYMDSSNSNSRICQNVIVGTGSNYPLVRGLGAVMVEAAMAPNMVDHNFIWGSTYANGIYDYSSCKLIVAHNLIGDCGGAGVMILDVPGRGTIPTGNNRIFKNILINNGWDIEFYSPNNFSDYNLLGRARQLRAFHFNVTVANPLSALGKNEEVGLIEWRRKHGFDLHSSEVNIIAEFNPETLELAWSVQGEFSEGPPIEGMSYDFWNRSEPSRLALPGPFGDVPRTTKRVVVDPRLPGDQA